MSVRLASLVRVAPVLPLALLGILTSVSPVGVLSEHSARPQTQEIRPTLSLDDPESIAAALARLTTEGGSSNYLLVGRGDDYVQFAGERNGRSLSAVAAGNAYRGPSRALDDAQLELLLELGWSAPEPSVGQSDFYRVYELGSDEDQLVIADDVVSVFVDVYGWASDQALPALLTLE